MAASDGYEDVVTLICQIMCDAGRPLSRMEIVDALYPRTIANLRHILDEMLKEGMLVTNMHTTGTQTAVIRFSLSNQVNCDEL
jgi:hypothetical protein